MIENTVANDQISVKKIGTRKKALILRAGGLGDILILTSVARVLYKRGYDVDYFCGSPTGEVWKMLYGLPYFNAVKEISRIGDNVDCVKDEKDSYLSVEILKRNYDEVFDYKFSVENNVSGLNKKEGWRETINSNYTNWIDLSLSWANIDPSLVEPEIKRPEIALEQKYYDWVNSLPISSLDTGIVGIQLAASTLIRTWYRAPELPEMIHSKYPNKVVLIFTGDKWQVLSKFGRAQVDFPEDYDPLQCSAALISKMEVFISADSGMSHVAEALHVPTIGIYTTVPAWTRVKYYKYAHPLEASVECHPCFTLNLYCPIEERKALESLTPREKDIWNGGNMGIPPQEIAKKYSTVPRAVLEEFQSIQKKISSASASMPACVGSITPEMIMNKLAELVK